MSSWNDVLADDDTTKPRVAWCPWCRSIMFVVVPTTPDHFAARCMSCGAQGPEARSPGDAAHVLGREVDVPRFEAAWRRRHGVGQDDLPQRPVWVFPAKEAGSAQQIEDWLAENL